MLFCPNSLDRALFRASRRATLSIALLVSLICSAQAARGDDLFVFSGGQFRTSGPENSRNLESILVDPTGDCAGGALELGGDGDYWCSEVAGFFDCGPATGTLPRNEHRALDRINLFEQPDDSFQVFWDVVCEGDNQQILTDNGQSTATKVACSPDDKTLCLNDGRFEVDVNWSNPFSGGTQQANVGGLVGGSDTGTFYFNNPSNVEFFVKVLDACGLNDAYWVFAAGATDVALELTVTDTETGQSRVYSNPLGQPAVSVTDTSAFATCP